MIGAARAPTRRIRPEFLRPPPPRVARPEIIGAKRREAAQRDALDRAADHALQQLEPVVAWGRCVGHVWRDLRGRPLILPWTERSPYLFELASSLTSYSAFRGNFSKRWIVPIVKSTSGVKNATYFDLWPTDGTPAAGAFTGSALDSRTFDENTLGAVQHGGNQSPALKVVLAMMGVTHVGANAGAITLRLYDRVLTYEGCTIATSPTLSNTNAATRWISAGDPGLLFSVFCQTATGATPSAFASLAYTDQDGNTGAAMPTSGPVDTIISVLAPTTGRAARMMAPVAAGNLIPISDVMPLAAGDIGMRAITAYTMSAGNTGTMYFLLWRPVATVVCPGNNEIGLREQVFTGCDLPIVKDGACLALMAMHAIDGGSYTVTSAFTATAG